jgi:hypothetical protein
MESTRTWLEVAISYNQFQHQMKASFEQKAQGRFPTSYAAKRYGIAK